MRVHIEMPLAVILICVEEEAVREFSVKGFSDEFVEFHVCFCGAFF